MAKKDNKQPQEQEQEQATVPAASATGANDYPKTLTAATREDLFEQVEALKATVPEGQILATGAVGRSRDDGTYSIQVDII